MSGFRTIRPSNNSREELQSGESSSQAASAEALAAGKARKRRTPTHVSQNACTNCKRARAKCDGEEPAPCTRCTSRNIADLCTYEVHVKTAKEELVRKVREVEDKFSLLESSVLEKDWWIENVVRLLSDENSSVLPNKLLLDVIRRAPLTSRFDSASSVESSEPLSAFPAGGMSDGEARQPAMILLDDYALIHHLMALYFTWVHPVHMLFSERHFTTSFQASDSKYCSPSMINAICAVGCCYMTKEGDSDVDPKALGLRFYHESWRAIRIEEDMTPVSAISYAILFLYELSQGQARNASSHLRLAVESLRQVDKHGWTEEAFEVSLWGIHTLNTTWAAFTYQKPSAPISPRALVFENVELDSQGANWSPYRYAQHASSVGKPSHAIKTAKEFARLTQIIHVTINLYCGSRGRVTASAILRLYQRYLQWKEDLPDDITPSSANEEPLPHVFFLLIQFYVAVCQLFVPILEVTESVPATHDKIKAITIQNAKDGLDLISRYRAIYSNRFQPPLLSFCLVHLGEVLLRYNDKTFDEVVVAFCLEVLSEAQVGFAYTGPLQAMFCESALGYGLSLPPPDTLRDMMGGRNWQSYSREDKLDCCERLTFAQPVNLLLERLDPHIAHELEADLVRLDGDEGLASALLNSYQKAESERSVSKERDPAVPINRLVNQ